MTNCTLMINKHENICAAVYVDDCQKFKITLRAWYRGGRQKA
jgi:hypothetical protein